MNNLTRDEIHKEMLNDVSDTYDKSEGSFIYDSTKPAAIQFEKFSTSLENAKDKLSIENLAGTELEQRIFERTGIKRKGATKASDYVEITGLPGSVVNIGDKVASDNVFYSSMEVKVVDSSGKALVLFECDEYGTVGNVPANAIRFIPVTLPGIISVTNPSSFTDGYEAETDAALLERYFERIQTPSTSNNKFHFRNWAKEVTGVGDARVFPLWNGDNTVKVVIIDSNMQPADQELIASVQEYIDPEAAGLGEGQSSLGSFCTVVSANAVTINISFIGTLQAGFSLLDIQQSVSEKLMEYLRAIAFQQGFVSYAQIGSMILNSTGILDYSQLLVNDGVFNITVAEDEVAVLGEISIA
ncbi:baseplate J/gp47 family protein [Bacillus infantis]|uniref:baseplate J/gp47 family protein n=1 Tax=Bacillus infantis TaxID=324767 RepID=UPI003CFA3B3A